MNIEQLTYHTEAEYESAMDDIYTLMNKGEANLTETEKDKVRAMAIAAETYEDTHFPFPPSESIPEMVERKRFELNLTQAALADLLGLGKAKLSQILNGKREPDITFLKAVYQKLGIDPGILLDNA
jgi:antitoxin component HigA of HigAB toxin-antitoxin module